jgi:hypothetical protein
MAKAAKPGSGGGGEGSPRADPRKPRPGLPNEESVVSEKTFTSPKGKRYRIIKTTEKDAYDKPDDTEKKRDSD